MPNSEQEHRADLVLLDPLTGDVEFPTDDHDRKKVLLVLAASLSIRAIYLENSVVIEISRQRPSWRVFDRHPRIFCRSSDLGSTRYCSAPVWRSS